MSTLNDNDLMLIERNGVQYKVESQYVNVGPDGTITSPVEVLTPVDGDGLIVGTQDGVITSAITAVDGDTITFAGDVSASLEAPLSMVDANGNPVAATTSVVSSTVTVPGVDVSKSKYNFHWSGSTTINTGLSGNRMVWFKNYGSGYGIISDSVNFDGQYIPTAGDTISAQSNGITFNADSITSAGLMGASGTDHAFLFELVEAAEVFDIVNYTGDGSSSHVIPHNLGVEPGMIIIKSHDDNLDWVVWHKDVNAANALALNSPLKPSFMGAKVTAVSSENFTVNDVWAANKSASSFVAYVFAADTAGKVKCGTYTGNNSDNTINVGFEPGFILVKNINSNYHWFASTEELMEWSTGGYWEPSSDNAATVNTSYRVNQVSNGFKLTGASSATNGSGENYIYLAIANEIASETTTQLTFQDNTNLDQLTSGSTITSNAAPTSGPTFSVDTYTGDNTTGRNIDTGINLAADGGLVWIKSRGPNTNDHFLADTERGATKYLSSNTAVDEVTNNATLTSFNSNGFTLGSNSIVNGSSKDLVSWTFRKASGFFDIVTYSGNSTGGRSIPHNLGSNPGMIIIKAITDSGQGDWMVWHKDAGQYEAKLNSYHAFQWGVVTSASDTEFTLDNGGPETNLSGHDYVAYVFADNSDNEIKAGSYTGAGYGGRLVTLGFKPHWLLIKKATGIDDWAIVDSTRGNLNELYPNNADEEDTGKILIDFNPNGFYIDSDSNNGGVWDNSGETYIYLAIGSPTGVGSPLTAELAADADPSTNTAIINTSSWPTGDTVTGPTATATASSFNSGSYSNPGFSATTYSGTGIGQSISTGIDLSTKGLIWFKGIGGSAFQTNQHSHFLFDSERNNYGSYLQTSGQDAQGDFASIGWNPQPAADGTISNLQANLQHLNVDYVAWAFRALPGFFDIQSWTGDGTSGRQIAHDLGSAPGMIIIKTKNSGWDWNVLHRGLGGFDLPDNGHGAHPILFLQYDYGAQHANDNWTDQYPDANNIYVNWANLNMTDEEYVAYLFADNPSNGIKCGTYSGNDLSQTIDCGFGSDKAAFIMVKCTSHSSPSGWIMCDTSRLSGNSYHTLHDLYANLNISQLNNGRIGSVAGGFTLNDGNNDTNRAGRTYMYMAISENSGESGNLASNQIKANGVTGTFQVGTNVKGSDYIYEIASQSSAITAVDGNTLTFADQDGLVQMTAPVSTDTGTATGFNYGSTTSPTFATTLYSYTGVPQTIANGVDLAGAGGLVWTKWRSGGAYSSESHCLIDTERSSGSSTDQYGTLTPYLKTDGGGGEGPQTNAHYFNFNSDGYEINTSASLVNHDSGGEYVSWTFRKAPGFFDIVTYSGSGAAGNVSIAHNLGSVPGMILVKSTSHATGWVVYHTSLGATKYLSINGSAAPIDSDGAWHDTEPTSTHFTLGNYPNVSWGGRDYVAYLFADNPSNGIKCGRYTGTGGPQTIDCGFEPQWIMFKQITDDYRDWTIVDNVRGGGSGNTGRQLGANNANAESGTNVDFVSNGFELFDASSEVNGVGSQGAYEYIYIAISAGVGETIELETNQASLQGVTGTFSVGQTVTGSAQVADHPLTSEIEFKSVNGASGTGAFNGTDCTLNARIWTLETASDINGPWTVVDTYIDTDANASQDGVTPWTTGTPTLQPNTIYRVKVKYQTADSAPVESTYHTFKTGAS